MKAVRVHAYKSDPSVDDIAEPTLQGPLDVIVKIGGAGVCRTDLHIVNGDWEAIQNPDLPYVIGHENAGWVHEIGDAVSNVKVERPRSGGQRRRVLLTAAGGATWGHADTSHRSTRTRQ